MIDLNDRRFATELRDFIRHEIEAFGRRTLPDGHYGYVFSVNEIERKASVLLSGQTEPSGGFSYPAHLVPVVGNYVSVEIDGPDRRIMDIWDGPNTFALDELQLNGRVVMAAADRANDVEVYADTDHAPEYGGVTYDRTVTIAGGPVAGNPNTGPEVDYVTLLFRNRRDGYPLARIRVAQASGFFVDNAQMVLGLAVAGVWNDILRLWYGGDLEVIRDLAVDRDLTVNRFWLGGGTTFPASPPVNGRYYRTDRHRLYFWDGTRWLSDQLFTSVSTGDPIVHSLTGSRLYLPFAYGADADIWVERIVMTAFVVTSTLNATNKWVVTAAALPSGAAFGGTIANVDSGSTNVWRSPTVATPNALLGADSLLRLTLTKTGAPGDITALFAATYRLVG